MNYKLLALLSAIILACVILLVKYISKHVMKDFNSFFFWTYVTTLPFIGLISLKFNVFIDLKNLALVLISSIFLTTGTYLFAKGVFSVDASIIGPLFQLQSAFIVLLASIFLNERHSLFVYGFMGLLMLGAMLVSVTDKTKLKGMFEKGVLLIIGMQLLHASSNIVMGMALKQINHWQALFWANLFNAILVSIYTFGFNKRITYEWKKIKWLLLRAGLLMISSGMLYKAFETNVSISASFGLLSSPLVFLVSALSGIFIPGILESQSKKTYFIRTIGMLVIIFAAWEIFRLTH